MRHRIVRARLTGTTSLPAFPAPSETHPLLTIQTSTLQVTGDPSQLRFFTLGRFEVLLPGRCGNRAPVSSNPQVIMLLKCLLAAPGHEIATEQAMEWLWPEHEPAWSRERLRDTLSRLRRLLEPRRRAYGGSTFLNTDRERIKLLIQGAAGSTSGAWLDCDVFFHLAEATLNVLERGEDARSLAQAALALYQGPFLAQDRYVNWARTPRYHYHRQWHRLLRGIAQYAVARRDFEHAVVLLGDIIDDAPDDEDAVAMAMALHAQLGRRGTALRLYRALCSHLEEEALEMVPMVRLQRLRDAIRGGESMQPYLMQPILREY